MSKIQSLPDSLINQIAAGEMIERPASIIKELVENAIDAGATQIEIKLEGGGIKKIQITDNGEGIEADELPLALMRHATSKIRIFDDLWQVQSMGFRGEALASIASAAQLQMISNTTNAAKGVSIRSEAGVTSTVEPAHHPRGTTIVIRDLFFNIPARRQFLKSEATEISHCLETCRRLAMIVPHIAWHVSHNGRKLLELPIHKEDDIVKRWHDILGASFFSHCRHLEEKAGVNDEWNMHGILILPSALGTTIPARRESQYLYVNRRFVRDRTIVHALREGYAEMKHDAKRLAYILMMTVPPDAVDVNVSPTKTEVRFRQSGALHQLVRQSVRKALAGTPGEYAAPVFSPSSTTSSKKTANLTLEKKHDGDPIQPILTINPSYRPQHQSSTDHPKNLPARFSHNHTQQVHSPSRISSALNFYERSTVDPSVEKEQASYANTSMPSNYPPLAMQSVFYIICIFWPKMQMVW